MSKAISLIAICALQFLSQSANAQCHPEHQLHKVPHGYHQVVSTAHCGYNLPPARYATLSRSNAAWSQVSSLPVGIAEPMWGYLRGPFYPYGYGQSVYNGEPIIIEEPIPVMDPDMVAEMPAPVPYNAPIAQMPPRVPYNAPVAEMPPQVPYAPLAEMPPNPFSTQSPVRTPASSGF